MTAGHPHTDQPVERPDGDDYDLLTFGEVAARLAEELAAEQHELNQLRRQGDPDARRIQLLEERIALLTASEARYREQEHANTAYARRFGTTPPTASADAQPN
ncbi:MULTISPECIES: hypothetical protein [unclassified Mycobacterium]|uniref:hypothetical protein n=1 Tax=unclassified Mycobacterium TaxID=2642494 RepID=UPI0029C95059|nr:MULTISPECIES: hypothetical protein [unclassified Mycobacterium]